MGTKPKQHIWRCPKCQEGIRAPTRIRKIDTRRYCLECSATTGILVERVCVARKSAEDRKKKQQAEARQKAKAAEKMYPWVLHQRHKEWMKLDAWEGHYPKEVELQIKRLLKRTWADWSITWDHKPNRINLEAGTEQWEAHNSLLRAMAWMAANIATVTVFGKRNKERDRTYQVMYDNALADLGMTPEENIPDQLRKRYDTEVAPRVKKVRKKRVSKVKPKLSEEEKTKRRLEKKRKARKAKAEW